MRKGYWPEGSRLLLNPLPIRNISLLVTTTLAFTLRMDSLKVVVLARLRMDYFQLPRTATARQKCPLTLRLCGVSARAAVVRRHSPRFGRHDGRDLRAHAESDVEHGQSGGKFRASAETVQTPTSKDREAGCCSFFIRCFISLGALLPPNSN